MYTHCQAGSNGFRLERLFSFDDPFGPQIPN
jgi:hypothetical protein